jgi:hypothetical protein
MAPPGLNFLLKKTFSPPHIYKYKKANSYGLPKKESFILKKN